MGISPLLYTDLDGITIAGRRFFPPGWVRSCTNRRGGQIGEEIFTDSPKAARGGCSLDAPAGAAACQSAKNPGILGVFQVFGAKTGKKFTVKIPAAAIGIAS